MHYIKGVEVTRIESSEVSLNDRDSRWKFIDDVLPSTESGDEANERTYARWVLSVLLLSTNRAEMLAAWEAEKNAIDAALKQVLDDAPPRQFWRYPVTLRVENVRGFAGLMRVQNILQATGYFRDVSVYRYNSSMDEALVHLNFSGSLSSYQLTACANALDRRLDLTDPVLLALVVR